MDNELTMVAEPNTHVIKFVREVDAPVELVFATFLDPALVPQWWGPEKYVVTVDRMEPVDRGSWRSISVGEDGVEHAFNGIYHSITKDERIINLFAGSDLR